MNDRCKPPLIVVGNYFKLMYSTGYKWVESAAPRFADIAQAREYCDCSIARTQMHYEIFGCTFEEFNERPYGR